MYYLDRQTDRETDRQADRDKERVSNLVFYAQSISTVISERDIE